MALRKTGKGRPRARRRLRRILRATPPRTPATSKFSPSKRGIRNRDGGGRGNVLAADLLLDVGLAGEDHKGGLDDTAAKAEHEVEGRLLLDVVIREGAAILELLAREDETLLVRGDALLVLDLRLHVVDGVRGLHLQGDGLTRDCAERKRREGSVFWRTLRTKGRGGTRRRARANTPGAGVGRIVVARWAWTGGTAEDVASTPPAKQETRTTPQTRLNRPRVHRETRSSTRRRTAADALGARERPRTRGNRHRACPSEAPASCPVPSRRRGRPRARASRPRGRDAHTKP